MTLAAGREAAGSVAPVPDGVAREARGRGDARERVDAAVRGEDQRVVPAGVDVDARRAVGAERAGDALGSAPGPPAAPLQGVDRARGRLAGARDREERAVVHDRDAPRLQGRRLGQRFHW